MITCRIFTPEGTKEELMTEIVTFDAPHARRGIQPGHMPVVVSVEEGHLWTVADGVRSRHAIGEGVMYYRDGVATFLVSSYGEDRTE